MILRLFMMHVYFKINKFKRNGARRYVIINNDVSCYCIDTIFFFAESGTAVIKSFQFISHELH